jgi:hypothetical protein
MTPTNYGEIITELQMMPDEVEYMTSFIRSQPDHIQMVEWGSGGSTCKWLELLNDTQKLISIEHNPEWYSKVSNAIAGHFGNISHRFTYHHIIPDHMGLYDHGYGGLEEEHPIGLGKYINPSNDIFDSDIYYIDGIGRGACALTTLYKHRKPNPTIFLHDYVYRQALYDWVTQFFQVEIVGYTLAKLTIK